MALPTIALSLLTWQSAGMLAAGWYPRSDLGHWREQCLQESCCHHLHLGINNIHFMYTV